MNESFSLIKDRCTTCGGGLPCVLHDREMRRVILKERDEMPGFERMWEGRHDFFTKLVKINENTILCGGGRESLFFLKRKNNEVSEWTFESVLIKRAIERADSETISDLMVTPWGDVLCVSENGDFEALTWRPQRKDLECSVLRANLFEILETGVLISEDTWMFPIKNNKCVVVVNGPYADDLSGFGLDTDGYRDGFFLFLEKDELGEYKIEKIDSSSCGPGDIVRDGIDEGVNFRNLVPVNENSFLFCSNKHYLSRLELHPERQGDEQMTVERLIHADDKSVVGLLPFGRDGLIRLSEKRFVMHTGGGCLYVMDASQSALNEYQINQLNSFQIGQGFNIQLITPFSSDCFLAVTNEGAFDLWTMRSDGKWDRKEFRLELDGEEIQANNANNLKLFPVSTDPLSFFLLCGDKVSFWTIPPDKLKAYHERQAAQTASPSLPSDI